MEEQVKIFTIENAQCKPFDHGLDERLHDEKFQNDCQTCDDNAVINMSPGVYNDSSSPDTPQPQYDFKGSWINLSGILGCLRPVFSIIGKGGAESKSTSDEWEVSITNIRDIEYIACGGQATVFSAKLFNSKVAMKRVTDLKDSDLRILKKLNHPNIVKFKGLCRAEKYFWIIMEFCPNGTLFDLLKNQKNYVTIHRVTVWAKQIASGMHYLHSHKIIHRDLKSPNILIAEEDILRISDFGTSRTWNGVSEKMTFAGTVAWMAPEAIQEKPCSEKVDIWSFGVVLWELLTCEVPYNGMENSAIMYSVGSGKLCPPIPDTCPDGFKLIMQMCWKFNPRDRPSFKLILSHLEIASAEILSKFEDRQFFKTQESWKQEIKSKITQFVDKMEKQKIEYQIKEDQLIKKREMEIKQIQNLKREYEEKLKELIISKSHLPYQSKCKSCSFQGSYKKKKKPAPSKKFERRRNSNQSTTPTSPEHSLTSPESPVVVAPKRSPLPAKLNLESESRSSSGSRKRHHRTSSGSPRSSRTSRTSIVVDAGTQTDSMDISETDLSPAATVKYPQRVILQEFRTGSDEEGSNGNIVQLHYMISHSEAGNAKNGVQLFTRVNSRSTSPVTFDENDTVNKNITKMRTASSSEEYLESISKEIDKMTIDSLLSENGNVMICPLEKRILSEINDDVESTEDAANEDSLTDEDRDLYNHALRRRSSLIQ